MSNYSFENYYSNKINEGILDRAKSVIGIGNSDGTRTVDQVEKEKSLKLGAEKGTTGYKAVKSAVGIGTNLATGNLFGAGNSIWNLIDALRKNKLASTELKNASKNIDKIKSEMQSLEDFLISKEFNKEKADKIVNAVFEVQNTGQIGEAVWAVAIQKFVEKLSSGYGNIETKTFAGAVEDAIRQYWEEAGLTRENASKKVSDLMKQEKEAASILVIPEVKAAIKEFEKEDTQEEKKYKFGDVVQDPNGTKFSEDLGIVILEQPDDKNIIGYNLYYNREVKIPIQNLISKNKTFKDYKGKYGFEQFLHFCKDKTKYNQKIKEILGKNVSDPISSEEMKEWAKSNNWPYVPEVGTEVLAFYNLYGDKRIQEPAKITELKWKWVTPVHPSKDYFVPFASGKVKFTESVRNKYQFGDKENRMESAEHLTLRPLTNKNHYNTNADFYVYVTH